MLPEQIPALIASRYRVVRPIGEGNMGKVYLVEHIHTGEQFALKVLLSHVGANAKLVKRFKREAWLPARIKSEHVIRVIDADVAAELGGAPFLVMELLDGCDLEMYLDRQGKIAPAEVVGIFSQIARALDKAHEIGIIHRDLKPENIFLHKRPDAGVIVKVLDFGISKMMGEGLGGIEDAGLTRTGVVLGTPLYMPPEQATGDSTRIGPPSDMWALGLIAFRLLTGKLYWKSETVAELLVEILSMPMPPPSRLDSSLPPAFDEWFARSCNRAPDARWPTVGEQVAALKKAFGLTAEHVRPHVLIRTKRPIDGDDEDEAAEAAGPATIPSGGATRAENQRTQTRPSSRKFRKAPNEPTVVLAPAGPLPTRTQPEPAPEQAPRAMSATAGQTAVQAGPAARSPEAERRQLTVLACELVPQNELAARLDPKELREAQREYQDAFCQAARRANGYLAELRNDGLSVYFGYPAAREDDARQAVATAMDLVEIATKLSGQRERLQLDVRIGVHTGLVLAWDVRQAEGRPMAIAGVTPTTAARLKELAQRNTVLISGSTHRLVRGYFACLNLGMRTVRGATQPIETYQVSYESGARSRLEGITSRGLTPLIGRDLEIGLLMDRWQRVEDGAGQVVFVSGEAGIGKSRLARVFRERLEASAHMWVESRCLPHQRDRMLLPVAALFQSMFRLDGETPAQNLDKLERALKHFSFSPLETVPALASLLSLPLDSPYPKALPEPEEEQQKVQEVLLGVLSRMARRQPVVLMMADLHWADAATVSLVGRIIQEAPTSAIFILLTARPVFIPPWPARSHVTSLPLSRLTPKRIKTMAEEVAHGKSLPVEVIDQLIAKTDGIPLFIEELTKTILESGLLVEKGYEYELVAPLPQLVIPSTLRDALMARLDMLGAAKRVAQLAAILGKEFPYEVLEAVSALDPLILQGALDRLVDADLLYVRGRPPRARYTFKHVLMQDTAYESMLHSKRQGYHRNVAQILMDRFPDLVESQPEIVARHYTLGGMNDQAVPHWQRAAQGRLDIAVCEEATGYLTREILQLDSAPRGADRDRQEMALLASLCPLLRSAKGVAAPEVERAYARAKDAAERLKTSPDIFPMLMDVWQFYHAREDLDTALTLGKQALELAKGTSNRLLLMQAQGAIGATFLHMGKLALARLHLEQATTTDERDRRRPLLSTTGHDAGVTCLVNAAWTLWLTGYPEQSAQHAERALSLAKAISHPQSLYFASISNGLLHGCLGRGAIGPHAEPMSGLSVEQPAPFWAAAATLLEGAALVEQGKVDDGISTMTRALHTERSTSMRLWLGAFAAIVANACQRNNQAERGMSLLAEPVERLSRPGGDRLCEPEIYRLQGELTLMRVVGTGGAKIDRAEVERTFRHAIEVARTQEARMLALRAAVSLGRLLRDQDRRAEAADIIRSIFQSFTEGLDMPDMRDATLLLNSLHLK